MKLLIYLGKNGYNIITENGDIMEFVDKAQTVDIVDSEGKPDLKEAVSICVRHDYPFEIL